MRRTRRGFMVACMARAVVSVSVGELGEPAAAAAAAEANFRASPSDFLEKFCLLRCCASARVHCDPEEMRLVSCSCALSALNLSLSLSYCALLALSSVLCSCASVETSVPIEFNDASSDSRRVNTPVRPPPAVVVAVAVAALFAANGGESWLRTVIARARETKR